MNNFFPYRVWDFLTQSYLEKNQYAIGCGGQVLFAISYLTKTDNTWNLQINDVEKRFPTMNGIMYSKCGRFAVIYDDADRINIEAYLKEQQPGPPVSIYAINYSNGKPVYLRKYKHRESIDKYGSSRFIKTNQIDEFFMQALSTLASIWPDEQIQDVWHKEASLLQYPKLLDLIQI